MNIYAVYTVRITDEESCAGVSMKETDEQTETSRPACVSHSDAHNERRSAV